MSRDIISTKLDIIFKKLFSENKDLLKILLQCESVTLWYELECENSWEDFTFYVMRLCCFIRAELLFIKLVCSKWKIIFLSNLWIFLAILWKKLAKCFGTWYYYNIITIKNDDVKFMAFNFVDCFVYYKFKGTIFDLFTDLEKSIFS